MALSEEQEKKKLFDNTYFLIEKFTEMLTQIDKKIPFAKGLPNIIITYNNKLVELISLYRQKNMSFYTSKLKPIITVYFSKFISDAASILGELVNTYSLYIRINKFHPIKKEETKQKIYEIINIYKELDNKIFNFDFENDIIEVIKRDMEHFKADYQLNHEEIIANYNEELHLLGINQTVVDTIPEQTKKSK